MNRITTSSPKVVGVLGLLALLIPINALAATSAMIGPASSAGLAFARYIASVQKRDPFTESGPVGVEIEACLPGVYKETRFLAIRNTGESERGEYWVLGIEGDPIVAQEVIARYLLMEAQLSDLPPSSVAITPENYRFQYKGEIGTGSALRTSIRSPRRGNAMDSFKANSGSTPRLAPQFCRRDGLSNRLHRSPER